MQPVGEVAQLANGRSDLVDGMAEEVPVGRIGGVRSQLNGPELHGQPEQALLRTVMEVPLDAVPFGGLGGNYPRP